MTPTPDENKQLLRIVEELPTKASCSGFEDALKAMSEKYGSNAKDLTRVFDQYHEFFREQTTLALAETWQARGNVDFGEFTQILERSFRAGLLRMWCFGNEHSTRYAFPRLLDQFHGELEQLTNPDEEK